MLKNWQKCEFFNKFIEELCFGCKCVAVWALKPKQKWIKNLKNLWSFFLRFLSHSFRAHHNRHIRTIQISIVMAMNIYVRINDILQYILHINLTNSNGHTWTNQISTVMAMNIYVRMNNILQYIQHIYCILECTIFSDTYQWFIS